LGIVGEVARFISDYVVMSETSVLVLAAWVVAAWLAEEWDRFPHIAIGSPEKRCGKTTLLDLLFMIVPRPRYTTNISPAALYRVVELEKPTLLMDESQSISRRGSEASEVIREILNAGIGQNAKVIRCGGEGWDKIEEFSVYGPKVFAMIGLPDAVLADRCLLLQLKRKTAKDNVTRFRSRIVEPRGKQLHDALEKWAEQNQVKAREVYDRLVPFDIENDRMADLLVPLQVVLTLNEPSAGSARLAGIDGISKGLLELEKYARSLDELDAEAEKMSPGTMLLAACREIFAAMNEKKFLPTVNLIDKLVRRTEEPWARFVRGEPITAEALANLLRKYGIKSGRSKDQKNRGYWPSAFEDAWGRYLPLPPEKPTNPSNLANPAKKIVLANRLEVKP